MSYTKALKDFHDSEFKEVANKKGEELINWYLSHAPFGYYYAAEMLWKKADQRSKDEAIRYYKKFVECDDIREEAHEVKKAIKIVLKAYREGYGSEKEQPSAAQAFEQMLNEKGFKFPPAEKVTTETDTNKRAKRDGTFHKVMTAIATTVSVASLGIAINQIRKHL